MSDPTQGSTGESVTSPDPGDVDDTVVDAHLVDDEPGSPDVDDASDPGATTDNEEPEGSGDPVANGDAMVSDDPILTVDDGTASAFDAVARERDEYLDALRQKQADFENFRKQALKRQGDAVEHATGRLVEQLLPVFDACEAGIEHGDEGVTAIFTALLGQLEKAGLERLDPIGEPFDPNAHEAVMHEPADDESGEQGPVVAQVMRPGYRWKDRTLRAAMVKVRG